MLPYSFLLVCHNFLHHTSHYVEMQMIYGRWDWGSYFDLLVEQAILIARVESKYIFLSEYLNHVFSASRRAPISLTLYVSSLLSTVLISSADGALAARRKLSRLHFSDSKLRFQTDWLRQVCIFRRWSVFSTLLNLWLTNSIFVIERRTGSH